MDKEKKENNTEIKTIDEIKPIKLVKPIKQNPVKNNNSDLSTRNPKSAKSDKKKDILGKYEKQLNQLNWLNGLDDKHIFTYENALNNQLNQLNSLNIIKSINNGIDDIKLIKLNKLINSINAIKQNSSISSIYNINKYVDIINSLTNKNKCLFVLYDNPLCLSDIANYLGISSPAISQLFNKQSEKEEVLGLIIKGFVNKTVVDEAYVYSLTHQGKVYFDNLVIDTLIGNYEKELRLLSFTKKKTDVESKIDFFYEFFKGKCRDTLDLSFFSISFDFNDLLNEDPDLASDILDNYDESQKIMKIALFKVFEDMNITKDVNDLFVRISHLPKFQEVKIGELRSESLNQVVRISGSVTRCTTVLPSIYEVSFSCPACGNLIRVLQISDTLKEPSMCPCGRKGKFKIENKKIRDIQVLMLEELPEHLGTRSNQKDIKVIVTADLAQVDNQPAFEESSPLVINGVVREDPMFNRYNKQSTMCRYVLEAISIEVNDSMKRLDLSSERIKKIEKMANDKNIIKKLVDNFVPYAFERDLEKEAVLYVLASGGSQKYAGDLSFRDDAHALLVGDPGTLKSTILRQAHKFLIGSRWISGKSTSSVGLLGSVVKDDALGQGPVLQKGVLPLSNNSVAVADEIDKMALEDLGSFNEALENQCLTIAKWNKNQTFRTDCSLLAAANPKKGHFDRTSHNVIDQIALPTPILDRFDFIIPLFDTVDGKDANLASTLIKKYSNFGESNPEIIPDDMKCYLYYARTNFDPQFSEEAKALLTSFFVKLRTASIADKTHNVKVTPRTMEGLLRLARARAKLRLSSLVTLEDAKAIIKLKIYFYKKLGFELLDSSFEEEQISTDSEIFESLFEKFKDKDGILEIAKLIPLCEFNVEEVISELIEKGDYYYPKPGRLKKN